jgi:hypothetical protein
MPKRIEGKETKGAVLQVPNELYDEVYFYSRKKKMLLNDAFIKCIEAGKGRVIK